MKYILTFIIVISLIYGIAIIWASPFNLTPWKRYDPYDYKYDVNVIVVEDNKGRTYVKAVNNYTGKPYTFSAVEIFGGFQVISYGLTPSSASESSPEISKDQ